MPSRSVRFVELATKSLTDGTVPKNRKPKFELDLRIIDLSNVPLVSGTAFVKWHLPSSTAAEHRGRTPKAPIKDHKVAWNYETAAGVRLIIDRTGTLQDQEIHFEVMQEYSSGARADRISLGIVRLNLAEYVEGGEDDDGMGGITRRYLMQESKINSTVRIGVAMRQIDGDRNYVCPALKSAAVFGGIAGVMNAAESTDFTGSDENLPPSLASQKARDFGEMQDMYRRSLAASWTSFMNELPADQCIEDIFGGGDGWGKHLDSSLGNVPSAASNRIQAGSMTKRDRVQGPFAKYLAHSRKSSKDLRNGRSASSGTRSSTASGDLPTAQSSSSEESRNPSRQLKEINEFDLIEDLSSWRISKGADTAGGLGAPKYASKVM